MKNVLLLATIVLTGCATVPPNYESVDNAVVKVCAPNMLRLYAGDGQYHEVPIPSYNPDGCKEMAVTAREARRSGWERFGIATVGVAGNVATTLGPWGAVYGVAHDGFAASGKNISGSYNTHTEANPVDSSNRSTNNPNNSTNNSHNPVDNSDSRTNYDNPVYTTTTTTVPEVLP